MKKGNKYYQDIIDSAKTELDKWNNAPDDFKKMATEQGFNLGAWYTNMIKTCEQSMDPDETDAEELYYNAPEDNRVNIGDSKKLSLLRLDGDFPADDVFKDSVTASRVVHPITAEILSEHNKPLTKELLQKFKDAGIVKIDTAKTADLTVDDDFDDDYYDADEVEETTKINPNILGGIKDFGN